MLYLVRKVDEAIVINNNIHIKIVEIKRNSIKLGIEFPQSVSVLRKEVYDKIMAQNISASEFDLEIVEAENEDNRGNVISKHTE